MGASPTSLIPHSQAEKAAIQEQLERLLAHPTFKNSKRCPRFLRYIVECTLNGDSLQLKERSLGMDVFGRDADYDTSEDTIVRNTAGDVRRRIAQYYHEPGHENEIRIELPAGSYIPEFHLSPSLPSTVNPEVTIPPPSTVQTVQRRIGVWVVVLLAILLILIAGITWWRIRSATSITAADKLTRNSSALDRLWKPFLAPSTPVLLCIADPQLLSAPLRNDQDLKEFAFSAAQWAKYLTQINKEFQLKDANSTYFVDMRQGSTLLVGGFDNPWTMQALNLLPFGFAHDAKSAWITDRKDPKSRKWLIPIGAHGQKSSEDYALVARYVDANTGRWVMIAAGLDDSGTSVASLFLIDSASLDDLAKQIPRNWTSSNIEAVIKTHMVEGTFGRSEVLAAESW
jgi:hypothetical protein